MSDNLPLIGTVIVEDQSLSGLSREQLAKYRRHTVGMVFQSFNLIPSMSVLENVELPLRFAEVERTKRSAMAIRASAAGGARGVSHWIAASCLVRKGG